ncbi:preprotein translocase subunit SecE [Mycoplasmatota bacterium]|nr:preprotein translocase subunit SecE [Mycoplasmatota bacterium]
MNTRKETIYGIVKYVSGLLGFIGIILAIFTVTGAIEWFLIEIDYRGAFTNETKLILSLTSSILGIFFLFIAFSKQIDKFFSYLETHSVNQTEEKKGITIESIFFITIAVILIVLALLLAIGTLALKTNLPLLGNATKTFLIGALVVLAILAILTGFNETIAQSIKEMKKVHWPTGKEMVDYSKKVFTFIIFFSVFFLILDLFLTNAPIWLENIFGIDIK